MDKYSDIKGRILESAKSDDDIRAIIAIGSTTRSDVKADEYSDLDLFIITTNVEPWFSGEYPEKFGNVAISFIEDILRALKKTHELFVRITRELAQMEGYKYPDEAEKCAKAYLGM